MNPATKTTVKEESLLDPECLRLLQAEIEFWKEMIAAASSRQSAQSIERMQQALALAEFKWASLVAGPGADVTPFECDHRPRRQ